MASTIITVLAGVFAIASLAKIILLFAKKEGWLHITKKIYSRPHECRIFLGILAVILLYILLQEFTIVQIFAIGILFLVLVAFELLEYPNEATKIAEKVLKNEMSTPQLFFLTFWIFLLLWVLKEVFL